MKLLEVLCEKLINSQLFENAYRRQEVESKITNLALPITKHLIKILKWRDPRNYQKHIRDIDSWIYDIQTLTIKNGKRPTQQDYFKWMFIDCAANQRTLSRLILGLHRYSNLPVLRTDEEVFDIIKMFFWNISKDLSLDQYQTLTNYIK
jgi:hypothetical protein